MTDWSEVPAPISTAPRRWRAALPVVVPLCLAGLFWALGLRVAAAAIAIAAIGLAAATAVRPSVAARIEAVLASVGRGVGHVLTAVLLGLVEAVVFLPLSLLARLFRRDPLTRDRRGSTGGQWSGRTGAEDPAPRRPYALEAVHRTRGPVFRVAYASVRVIGWVVIVLVLNYALGWTWDEFFGSHDTPVAAAVSEQTAGELAASPAMADAPWARDYWREFRALDYEFHPYLLSRVAPTDGRYVQVDGAVRRSYEPEDLPDAAPEVWFLGGAALWGEGQRDLLTIPSMVAKAAEAAGTPIRAVNLGQPGYTSWQAALLLEQELAVRPAPDLVVFYDGAADVAVQLEQPSRDPSHYNVRGITGALTGRDSAREQAQGWWDDYRETSVVNRLLEQVQGVFGVQAAAADEPGLGDRVADLHARSVDLARFVAGEHDVDTLFTWQAASGVAGDGGAYRQVAGADDQGPNGAVDLSEALDDEAEAVYLDGVLTNERGAEVVAGRLWALIAAELG